MAIIESSNLKAQNSKLVIFIFLLIILVIASFFRLWQLDKIPPGLYPDVAIYANDALDTLKTGDFKIFYPENNGREGLWMWILAFSFSIFGISVWTIKFTAAIIGILTVIGLYLLTKEIFKLLFNQSSAPTIVALLSSFFLATSFWHTLFSRIGFRAILLPFVLVFAFYFLFRGFRQKSISNLILAGTFLGLGFYTYISYRFVVILLPIILFGWLLIYLKENQTKKFFLFAACCLIFTFIVALPIGIYFLQNPQDFVSRATGVSVFQQENPIKAFFVSLAAHLGMFNFYGDGNWRHNFAASPMLFWPVGILFLIGIMISIKEFFVSLKNRNWPLFTTYNFLLAWFFALLLPGVLTYEGIPHALRVIGVIPVVYIFTGLGGWWLYSFLYKSKYFFQRKSLLIFFCFLFLFFSFYSEFYKYFFEWANRPKVKEAFTVEYFEIGNYLNSLPLEVKKYVIVNELGNPLYGISIPGQTPMFIETTKYGKPQATYLRAEEIEKITPDNQKTVIIPLYNKGIEEKLREKFPNLKTENKDQFWVYKINF